MMMKQRDAPNKGPAKGAGETSGRGADERSRPSLRWWPAALIVLLAAGVVAYFLGRDFANQQAQVMNVLATLILAGLALLLWLLLFSRLPWRRRFSIVGMLMAGILVFVGLFRIEGVTGNFVPILDFRFAGGSDFGDALGRVLTPSAMRPTEWDSPQFLGAHRDAEVPDPGLATDWDADPPRELWRRPVGEGWSGFAVVGSTAVTLEQRTEDAGEGEMTTEVVAAYDLRSGEPIWTHSAEAAFETVVGGNGPRSTPTIEDGRVYAYGATGILRALSLDDGELFWQRDVKADHPGPSPEWGYAASPLLTPDGLVVVSAGGEGSLLVAYDAETGEPRWSGGDDDAGYSSPSLHVIDGVPQILSLNASSVTSHDPATGEALWTTDWYAGQPNVAQPVVLDDDDAAGGARVLASTGYGRGSKLFQVHRGLDLEPDADAAVETEWTVEEVWRSPRMKAKFTNLVVHEGFVYGLDDGVLVCLDPSDGSRRWKRGRYGHGQILLVGDLLLVQSEDGEILLVEATPEEHRELASMQALSDKSWNQPTLVRRILLVRNHKEAAAYELPLADENASAETDETDEPDDS